MIHKSSGICYVNYVPGTSRFFAVVERKNYISGTFHLADIAYGWNSRKLICGTLRVFCDGGTAC